MVGSYSPLGRINEPYQRIDKWAAKEIITLYITITSQSSDLSWTVVLIVNTWKWLGFYKLIRRTNLYWEAISLLDEPVLILSS